MQVTFFKVLLKFKMAATDQLKFFGWRKKIVWSFFLHFNITFLATWGCASDFYPSAIKAVGYSDHQRRAVGRAGRSVRNSALTKK